MTPQERRGGSTRAMTSARSARLLVLTAAAAWMPMASASCQRSQTQAARGSWEGGACKDARACALDPGHQRLAFIDVPVLRVWELGGGLRALKGDSETANTRSGGFEERQTGLNNMAFVDAPVVQVQKLWGGLQMLIRGGEQFQEQAPTEVAALGAIELLKHTPQVACSMCGALSYPSDTPAQGLVRQCEQCGSHD